MVDRNDEAVQRKTNIGDVKFAFGGVKFQGIEVLNPVETHVAKKPIVHRIGRVLLDAELLRKMLQRFGYGSDIGYRGLAGFAIRQKGIDDPLFDHDFGNGLQANVGKAVDSAAEIVAFQHHRLGVVIAHFQKNRNGRHHIRQLFFDVGVQLNLLGRADHCVFCTSEFKKGYGLKTKTACRVIRQAVFALYVLEHHQWPSTSPENGMIQTPPPNVLNRYSH